MSLCIAAFGIPLTTATTGLRGILEAYGAFRIANVLRLALGVANFGLPALCVVWFGPSLVWMIVSLVAQGCWCWSATGWPSTGFCRQSGSARPLPSTTLEALLLWCLDDGVQYRGPLMVTADRFVIAAVLGAQVVAFYTVPSEMLMRMLILPTALTTVLFPQLAALLSWGSRSGCEALSQVLRLDCGDHDAILFGYRTVVPLGLSLWLGAPFADQSWLVVVILTVGIWVNSIAFVTLCCCSSQRAGTEDRENPCDGTAFLCSSVGL